MKVAATLILLLMALTLRAFAADTSSDLEPYPLAEPGFVRTVVRLPPLPNEADHKVEIVAGKPILTDCNTSWFSGDLKRRVVSGWGYSFHVLEAVSAPASTMMACPPDTQRKETFVQVRGEGYLLRYNSRLPVVTYVPEGVEVHYRIWSAGADVSRAEHQ